MEKPPACFGHFLSKGDECARCKYAPECYRKLIEDTMPKSSFHDNALLPWSADMVDGRATDFAKLEARIKKLEQEIVKLKADILALNIKMNSIKCDVTKKDIDNLLTAIDILLKSLGSAIADLRGVPRYIECVWNMLNEVRKLVEKISTRKMSRWKMLFGKG